jgi:acetyl esterase/lipase
MPLAKLFADRVHYFSELPFMEAYPLFDAPISKYHAPPLDISEFVVASPDADVPVLVYRPARFEGKLPVIIWMHGGGFQQGTYTMNESAVVGQELAHRGNFIVVNVEYRLVNEKVKFPAPQDDCMAVLAWVHENIHSLGGTNKQIFVGGVSAGGCLAASMAVLDRDLGNHFISGQLLNCPIVHVSLPELSPDLASKMGEVPKELGFTAELIDELNQFVLSSGNIVDMDPAWMPGLGSDLSGLPPAQIINCEYDTLRASGERYGEQLLAAGVPVEMNTELGVPHAHLNRVPEDCPEVSSTISKIIQFVNGSIQK